MTQSENKENILILVPAYNEGRHVADVVKLSQKYFPVLVVDDGSKDDTAARALEAGAQVLRQNPNQGKGAALINGFREAIRLAYDAVIMLDADMQHDPLEIPLFVSKYRENHSDLIIGEREFRYMPRLRRTTNTIGTWMFSWSMGQHIPDNQSGYRLLSKRMMEATLESRETNFEFEVEMIVLCIHRGFQLDWVPIRTIYGDEKSHIRPVRHAYHFIRMVLESRRAIQRSKNKST